MKLIPWIVLVLLSAPTSNAVPFKILSYNVLGMPWPIAPDLSRLKDIAKETEKMDLDVVAFQEAWTKRARDQAATPSLPYWAKGPTSWGRFLGSGLQIRSKRPIDRMVRMHFNACEGDDCLSKKGALLVETSMADGKKIQILTTHINARGGDSLRLKQIQQLIEFSKYWVDPSIPLLVTGDFNSRETSKSYSTFVREMGVIDCWRALFPTDIGLTYDTESNPLAKFYNSKYGSGKSQERIDYIFLQNNGEDQLQLGEMKIEFTQPVTTSQGRQHWLSDHYGLSATYL
jgi:endonuclease/exonuclease/phosphatase family metal-dependent hydrolase